MARRDTLRGLALGLIPALAVCLLAASGKAPFVSAPQEPSTAVEATPPADQTYVGYKVCSSCHFEQFGTWRQDKHAEAFSILPDKYKTDASCLECHTTGFGSESGFKTAEDSHLASTSCESCHGPGSTHAEICQEFKAVTKLSAEQEAKARDSIYRIDPHNSCVKCHTSKAHQAHPDFDK